MWKNLYKTWSSNHGWLLSGASLIVGLVASCIWYLDLVPQLNFVSGGVKQPLISQSIQPQNGVLVAQVNALPESKRKKGRILLYTQSIDQTQTPEYQEKFEFDERGNAAILLVVPASEYMAIAFIDDNDNGQLDFDGETALESFRLPRTLASGQVIPSENPAEGGVIKLQPQVPMLCTFDFTIP